MTHKYKVGDKIRMLEDHRGFQEGEVYLVAEVDNDDSNYPVALTDNKVWPPSESFELATDNTDLTDNRIPWGLLDPEVQDRMKAWVHGLERWVGGEWSTACAPLWSYDLVYRAKPAPVEPERETRWICVYPMGCIPHKSRKLADTCAISTRIAVWRITSDKETGLNPAIEVEDV